MNSMCEWTNVGHCFRYIMNNAYLTRKMVYILFYSINYLTLKECLSLPDIWNVNPVHGKERIFQFAQGEKDI